MTSKREVFFKRYLGLGFYLKREGDSYWLGHKQEKSIQRVRISKGAYDELLKTLRLVEKRIAT